MIKTESSFMAVRPCVKCGATERYADGKCKACARSRNAAKTPESKDAKKLRNAAYRKANPDKNRELTAAYKLKNPEKVRADARAFYAKHKDRLQGQTTKWRKRNPDKATAHRQKWRSENPHKVATHGKTYRQNNPEKVSIYRVAYRQKNSEKARTYMKVYRKAYPHVAVIHRQNRRARKGYTAGTLSRGLIEKLMRLQQGQCACCGKSLADGHHLDHVMPLALGGVNEDDNMQLLTPTCNMQKHAKHPVDFMQSRGFLL